MIIKLSNVSMNQNCPNTFQLKILEFFYEGLPSKLTSNYSLSWPVPCNNFTLIIFMNCFDIAVSKCSFLDSL